MTIQKKPKSRFDIAEFEISIIERALNRLDKIKKYYRDNNLTWQNKTYYKSVDVYSKLALEHGETLRGYWKEGIFI